MPEVVAWVEFFDNNAKDVTRGIDDFADVVSVSAIPFADCAEGDGGAVLRVATVGLGVLLRRGVVGAAFDYGLQS